MRRLFAFAPALALLVLAAPAAAQSPQEKNVAARVRAQSVSVETPQGGGSGTLFLARDGQVYCLTAAHVVEGHAEAKVCRHLTDARGRSRGAWVVAAVEHVCQKRDLALLSLGEYAPAGARFGSRLYFARLYAGEEIPGPDTPIYTCGSANLIFHHSLHRGHVTAVGRKLGECLVDEDDIAGGPGTSGGGVYLRTGELIGVHVASNRLRAGLFVPARVIRAWAAEGGFLDALEAYEAIPAPKEGSCSRR